MGDAAVRAVREADTFNLHRQFHFQLVERNRSRSMRCGGKLNNCSSNFNSYRMSFRAALFAVDPVALAAR